jgi:hypothetical protein
MMAFASIFYEYHPDEVMTMELTIFRIQNFVTIEHDGNEACKSCTTRLHLSGDMASKKWFIDCFPSKGKDLSISPHNCNMSMRLHNQISIQQGTNLDTAFGDGS